MGARGLAIIVPTLNEEGNVEQLVNRLERVLAHESWEIVFVDDDSTDGTIPLLRRLAAERDHVRLIHRIGRRGLASACIEGIQSTTAPLIAVMDADLQHDETVLPIMLEKLRTERLDIVVASRFADGSDAGDGLTAGRRLLSRIGNRLCHLVMKASLSDPLSGFFLMRREMVDGVVHGLSGKGFKILLDIFATTAGPVAWAEVPMRFRPRGSGASKLDRQVLLEFILLLADKSLGRTIPVQFVLFVLVGLTGVLVHLAVLGLLFLGAGLPFLAAQVTAILAAMTSNFFLNNEFTHRDRRLRGWPIVTGLLSFYAACSLGAFANYQMASVLYGLGTPWLLAGLVGAGMGAVWNYAVSSVFTWRRVRPAGRPRLAGVGAAAGPAGPARDGAAETPERETSVAVR